MAASSKKFQKEKSNEGKPKFNKASKKQFKTKKDSDDAVKSEAVALQLEDDVPDFPRGFSLFSFNFLFVSLEKMGCH